MDCIDSRRALVEDPAVPHVLAAIGYGRHRPSAPVGLRVPLRQLGDQHLVEVWRTAERVRRGEEHGFRHARTKSLLFGAFEEEERGLEHTTYEVYSRLLERTRRAGFELVRIWNTIARLHDGPADLDRYMQFCQGRARAFEGRYGAHFEQYLPACSAVGSSAGPLVTYFLAARQSSHYLENPRQVSAYDYPPRYGPKSPSFARASQSPESAGGWLMISGTASILGHASVHADDVREQTIETLRNIRVLVHGLDGIETTLRGHMPRAKVYLRNPSDLEQVRPIIERELGARASVLFLRAEICRRELLVEIEGLARPARAVPAAPNELR